MLMQRRYREQRRDRQMVFVHAPVGEDQDIRSRGARLVRFHIQAAYRLAQLCVFIVQDRDLGDLEAGQIHSLELEHSGGGQDRIDDLDHLAVIRLFLQQIAVLADIDGGRGDDLLADCVDRRIGHLREVLFEIIEQRLRLIGQDRERFIGAHRGDRLCAVLCHRQDRRHHVLVGVAECLLQAAALLPVMLLHLCVRHLQIFQAGQVAVEPFAVGSFGSIMQLDLFIADQSSLHGVHEQHLARMEALLLHDPFSGDRQGSDLGAQDQMIVVGDIVSRRPQSVSVEHRAHHIAVREQDRRGTVPRLHHRRVVLIKVAFLLRDRVVVVPRLWNSDHHGKRQLHSTHH